MFSFRYFLLLNSVLLLIPVAMPTTNLGAAATIINFPPALSARGIEGNPVEALNTVETSAPAAIPAARLVGKFYLNITRFN
jgi:hypothetical protein